LARTLDHKESSVTRTAVNVDGVGRLSAFSHAVVAGDHIYVAGTLGTDGDALVPGGVGPETTQILRNFERILAGVRATLDDVVKCGVFLTDMSTFGEMNDAYTAVFGLENPPARITVGCSGLAIGAGVEIDCVAYRPAGNGRSPSQ
jgi:2-iminobutanoate/2-iminopropanoate deaminase